MTTPEFRRESARAERRSVPRRVTPFSVPALTEDDGLEFPLKQTELEHTVRAALQEDGAFNDLTTIAVIVSDRRARASLVAREAGVIAGVSLALEAFRLLDPKVNIRVDREDGSRVARGEPVLNLAGHTRALLSAERVALNFMQRMSGIASATAKFVDAVKGTKAKILDTRKTTPGWRALEKYAVRAGGGVNHRMDLAHAVLIKDNHLAAVDGDVGIAIKRARELAPKGVNIEVECESLDHVKAAVKAEADIILLDNMAPAAMKECVDFVKGRATIEASGGVNLGNVRKIAETGVDWISTGSITHSAPALNLALDFE